MSTVLIAASTALDIAAKVADATPATGRGGSGLVKPVMLGLLIRAAKSGYMPKQLFAGVKAVDPTIISKSHYNALGELIAANLIRKDATGRYFATDATIKAATPAPVADAPVADAPVADAEPAPVADAPVADAEPAKPK